MKKVMLFFLVVLCLLTTRFYHMSTIHSAPLVYEDERMKICYNGIVEKEQLWMTERGIEDQPIQSISLKITNYTESSFFISGSTLIVDGYNASPIEAVLRIWADGTHNYEFCSENLHNLNPSEIQVSLYVFDLNDPETFSPYEINLNFQIS